ncbi:NAD-dependent epimerase/dehydratase family protein [Azospirillum sp. B4]|uniref:NAD-dependent epimerase/dehydratase family protein n=1 Tax=Azospirillum sp. B4 TaxID=95605 RepID=UPI0005C96CFF|nr:NAD-dependent epimerase/dehydratase family protein [Azospirillum sp. B4]
MMGGVGDAGLGRVAITGAAGFIGSHLVDALFRGGIDRIKALDSLRAGRWDNLGPWLADPRLDRREADFSALSVAELSDFLRGTDILFHLAAEKHNQAIETPDRVWTVNVQGTWRLFEAAVAAGVKKIVFTSSLYAHGGMGGDVLDEADLPRPLTPYGIAKLAGEHIADHFQQAHGIAVACLRLFFTYGPRQFAEGGYKSVIVRSFERLLAGHAAQINGSGKQELDYVYVGDVVDALLRAARVDTGPQPINIASGIGRSIIEVVSAITEATGLNRPPEWRAADWTEGSRRVGTVARAAQILGWRATTAFEDGLAVTYLGMRR